MSLGALSVLRRNLRVWSRYWVSNLISNFLEPFLYLLGMGIGLGYYVHDMNGMSYTYFIAPGVVASATMFAASFENTYGTYVRLQFQKTFDAMIATPLGVQDVVLGELLYGASKSLLYGSFITVVIEVFGMAPGWRWQLLAVPLLAALIGLLFGSLAMIVTGLIENIDGFNYYFTIFLTPLFIFSGIFFPLEHLPQLAQMVAWLTPLWHAVRLMRGLMLDNPIFWGDLIWLLVATLLLIPWPLWLMRRKLID